MSSSNGLSFLRRFFLRSKASPRQGKPRSGFKPELMHLEDRLLMSVFTPLLPSQGTHQAQGLNSVVYTPELDAGFDKNNLPAAKLVTLENNSSNVVYPIFYGANSTIDDQEGKVVRLVLDDPGLGYGANPLNGPINTTVTISGGAPTNAATAKVQVAGDGSLFGLEIVDGGVGYKPGDVLTVTFNSTVTPTKVAKASAFVAQYRVSDNKALYDPKDNRNETYRGYVGEKDAFGNFVLGLLPGHQATVQVPIAFWDGGRLYFATNGSVPLSTAQDPGNPLQNNTEWFYDATAPSFVVAPAHAGDTPFYGANFEDPVTRFANEDAVVMWYHKPGPPNDFGFGVPATLTEMTFRDPKQFHIAPDMLQREIDTIINYDVSYVDSLAMPASMAGTNVPLRGAPDGATGLTPGQFTWLGSDMSVSQMQAGIAKFTAHDVTGGQVGVPGVNGLGKYFGGRGYDQYYMPADNAPTRAITGINNTPGAVVRIITSTAGLAEGSTVKISGVQGQTAINATWVITNVNPAGSFDLPFGDGPGQIKGDGTPTTMFGTWTAQNTGVYIQKVPAGFQVITDGEVQNVQSSFDSTKYNLVSGGTKANIATLGTGLATAGSTDITGVSYAVAIQLAPGMLWSPVNKAGSNPPTPFFPNGTTIASIIPGTVGAKDWTIRMSAKANLGGSPGGASLPNPDDGTGGSFTFNGSQFTSETGSILANGKQITGLDAKNAGLYLQPGMLVTGVGIPTQTFIESISDFGTVTLTKNIGDSPSSGPYTFLGGPHSYIVQQLINVWYAWADYYVKQLNSAGPDQAPTDSFAGSTRVNQSLKTADDTLAPKAMDTITLDITQSNFDMGKLRIGDVVTSTGSTLAKNPTLNTDHYDPSLNYTIVGINTTKKTVTLSRPVAVETATPDTYTFTPPQYVVRSKDAPSAPGTAGTIPYTLDFSAATPTQKVDALNFSRTVYDVMQSFSILLDPETLVSRSALVLRYSIGGNVGSFVTNNEFADKTGRNTLLPHERTHLQMRDEIKSILRGVHNFLDPNFSSPTTWYPAPATPTPNATLNGNPVEFGIFNLNPYVWFIHTQLNMSGYGFSLDDDVANTTANTNSIEVAFGGNAYTAPVNTTKTPPDPPAPDLVNLEAYTGGAKFGTQHSVGFIDADVTHPKDFPGETRISGLSLEVVLKLVSSTEPSDPPGALITGIGLPPGVRVAHFTALLPVGGEDKSWVTFKTPADWIPPTQDQPRTEFTFSGFTTEVPDNIVPSVTSGSPGSTVKLAGKGFTGVLGVSFNGIPGALVAGAITSITNNAGTIRINTANTQGLANGDTVTISGVTGQTAINKQWIVTNVIDKTSFDLQGSTFAGPYSGGEWLAGTDLDLKVIVPQFRENANGTTFPGPSGKIGVRTPSGTDYSTLYFTIVNNGATPTFSGIGQPGSSTASGSLKSTVTLFGTGFTGASAVTFNGSSTPINTFTVNASGTELQSTIPVGSNGTGTFTITVGGNTYTSTGYTFTVNQPVIAASSPFSPASGPVGTVVTIDGTGFSGADDPTRGGVTIGGVAATDVTVINDNRLTAKVGLTTPQGAAVVAITTSAGTGNSGSNTFNVTAAQSFQDDFNRADSSTLGPNWTAQLGAMSVASNTARGNDAVNVATVNGMTAANVTVQARISSLGTHGQLIGLVARHSGPGDSNLYHGLVYNANGTARAVIYRNLGGTWTPISADVDVGSVASVAGKTLRFEVQGSTQKLFLDNTLVALSNDTAVSGAGGIGLRTLGNAALDNFQLNLLPALANGAPGTTYTFESPQRPDAQLDNVWTELLGNFAVTNVAGNNVAAGNGADNLATLNGVSAADVVVQAQVLGLGNGELVGLSARRSGSGMGNQYQGILYNANGTARAVIYRNVGGTWTMISADVAVGSVASVVGKTLRFEVQGSSLKLFLDNTLAAVTNDTVISGAGGVAMRTVGTASLDNFMANQAPPPASGSLGTTYTFESPQRPDGQLDNVWKEQTGNFKVANVAGNNVAMGNGSDNLATLNGVNAANVSVQAAIRGLANGELIGLSARYSGPGMSNQYQGILYNSGSTARAVIYRNVGGVWTMISADVAVGSIASILNSTLRFELTGSSLRLFVGGNLATSATDTAISGPGGVGMRLVGSASLDNFASA